MMKLGKHLIWHIQEDGKYLSKFFQFGLILGSILIICEVSTVFAQESQTKNAAINFQYTGRKKKGCLG